MKRFTFLWVVVCLLSAGCSVNIFGTVLSRRALSGQDIDRKSLNEIVPGTTTKREIVDRFGKPDQTTTNPDGTEEYAYRYIGVMETTNEKILWAKGTSKDERKRLRVVFAGDVVAGFRYTNSAIPEENFARQVGSSEVYLKTTEGRVAFTNDPNQLQLDVSKGLAAKVVLTGDGGLDVGVPDDNVGTLRMRVRSRFASANPGTDLTTRATGDETAVAVKQGRLAVRSRAGCEVVDAGAEKAIEASAGEAAATIAEIRFPAIHYGFKSTTPIAADAPLLDCVADLLGDYPEARVRIEGHSDNVGGQAFNQRLSTGRAEGVRRALVANGITASRLDAKGYGLTRPIATNRTEEGRAQNRRVEFVVSR